MTMGESVYSDIICVVGLYLVKLLTRGTDIWLTQMFCWRSVLEVDGKGENALR